jgi:hypothetical protein
MVGNGARVERNLCGAGIEGGNIFMVLNKRIKLEYLKGSRQTMQWAEQYGIDARMWNLVEPKLPGYKYDGGLPTFTKEGLKDLATRGLI